MPYVIKPPLVNENLCPTLRDLAAVIAYNGMRSVRLGLPQPSTVRRKRIRVLAYIVGIKRKKGKEQWRRRQQRHPSASRHKPVDTPCHRRCLDNQNIAILV
jgi:hypothetical protein